MQYETQNLEMDIQNEGSFMCVEDTGQVLGFVIHVGSSRLSFPTRGLPTTRGSPHLSATIASGEFTWGSRKGKNSVLTYSVQWPCLTAALTVAEEMASRTLGGVWPVLPITVFAVSSVSFPAF